MIYFSILLLGFTLEVNVNIPRNNTVNPRISKKKKAHTTKSKGIYSCEKCSPDEFILPQESYLYQTGG